MSFKIRIWVYSGLFLMSLQMSGEPNLVFFVPGASSGNENILASEG